ncbi:MAG: efflux RND transporter periplasmic adaptor subunit [Bacteroidetes bacterium]|nr:efflux RND transporter periplasmic adaptor subunit [Bacteroidota bacterium]
MEKKHIDLSALRINRNKEQTDGPPKKTGKYIGIGIAVLILIAACIYLYDMIFAPAVEVTLTTVSWTSPAQSNAVLTASGYVVAQRKAAVASKGTGRLVYLGVVEGDRVKKNRIIARLEDSDVRALLNQAIANLRMNEADLKDAQQSFKRQKDLLEKGLTTQAEYDAAEARQSRVIANIELAKAMVEGAEVNLENTYIRAPFDGTVLTKNADIGEMVVPMAASAGSKSAVVTIADMTSLQVEADVSESSIEHIKADQPCEITLDAYPQVRYQGYVAKIVPTADRAKATVLVKVAFRSYDSRVLPEMGAKVLYLTNASDTSNSSEKPCLTVPAAAVAERDGKKVVYRVFDDKACSVMITAGRTMGTRVEILSGMTSGEKVIDKVNETISDGIKVKVL